MTLFLTFLVFILVLSFLVLIHEAGHFISAKIFGIRVEEFGLGYPPLAKKLFRRWGADFTLNWFPFGGFVRLGGEEREEGEAKLNDPELFYNKPAWQRIVVILAGAAVNFVFGVIAFGVIFTFLGIPEFVPLEKGVLFGAVGENSPASESGLLPGDIVLKAKVGEEYEEIGGTAEFIEVLKASEGEELEVVYQREGEAEKEVGVYVRSAEETPEGEGAIGVRIGEETLEYVRYPLWQMPFRGAKEGVLAAVDFGILIVASLYKMFKDLIFSGVVPEDVSGPVGIVYTASKQNILGEGILGILNFGAILSINLAIVNVLPIPPLDGGRAVFIALEKLLGERFDSEFERNANYFGFMLLVGLIILVSIRDVGMVVGEFLR